jgi:hypothetical protein
VQAAKEELGHDELLEILGVEHTEEDKARALVSRSGYFVIELQAWVLYCSNSCGARSALWGGETCQGNAKGLSNSPGA